MQLCDGVVVFICSLPARHLTCLRSCSTSLQVNVGMGTLAGSTVMLLTIAYGGGILLGRCDRNPTNVSLAVKESLPCNQRREASSRKAQDSSCLPCELCTNLPGPHFASSTTQLLATRAIAQRMSTGFSCSNCGGRCGCCLVAA